jgi:acyl-coenzyme A thioesterase PaaI-like protein
MKWTPKKLKRVINLYPPYLGAGVRVTHVDPDWRELHVSMKLGRLNRNAVGTHFGGSLYSMVDPHLMLLLMQRLGPDYVVWDKSAGIEFLKPGRGTVRAVIRVPEAEVDKIRQETAGGDTYYPSYEIEVVDEQGDVVTRVTKTLYVRLRAARDDRSRSAD